MIQPTALSLVLSPTLASVPASAGDGITFAASLATLFDLPPSPDHLPSLGQPIAVTGKPLPTPAVPAAIVPPVAAPDPGAMSPMTGTLARDSLTGQPDPTSTARPLTAPPLAPEIASEQEVQTPAEAPFADPSSPLPSWSVARPPQRVAPTLDARTPVAWSKADVVGRNQLGTSPRAGDPVPASPSAEPIGSAPPSTMPPPASTSIEPLAAVLSPRSTELGAARPGAATATIVMSSAPASLPPLADRAKNPEPSAADLEHRDEGIPTVAIPDLAGAVLASPSPLVPAPASAAAPNPAITPAETDARIVPVIARPLDPQQVALDRSSSLPGARLPGAEQRARQAPAPLSDRPSRSLPTTPGQVHPAPHGTSTFQGDIAAASPVDGVAPVPATVAPALLGRQVAAAQPDAPGPGGPGVRPAVIPDRPTEHPIGHTSVPAPSPVGPEAAAPDVAPGLPGRLTTATQAEAPVLTARMRRPAVDAGQPSPVVAEQQPIAATSSNGVPAESLRVRTPEPDRLRAVAAPAHPVVAQHLATPSDIVLPSPRNSATVAHAVPRPARGVATSTDIVPPPALDVTTFAATMPPPAPSSPTPPAASGAGPAPTYAATATVPPGAARAPSTPAEISGFAAAPVAASVPAIPPTATPAAVLPDQPEARRIRPEASGAIATPTAVQTAQAMPVVAGTTAPAFRLFAAAIHAARRDERNEVPGLAPAATIGIDQTRAPLVAAPAEGAPLDMTSRSWPQHMVERIEGLREAASAMRDAASTSIRLVPDALGTIDVSVRTNGDTVHVHFAAEQAATRTMIAEAQPRLTELAEAKGLKLTQADVGTGTGAGAGDQRQPSAQPARLPDAPPSAVHDDEPQIATIRVA